MTIEPSQSSPSENTETVAEFSPELKTKIGVMVATPMRHFTGFNPGHEAFLKRLAELSVDDTCPYEFWQCVVEGGRTWGRCRVVSNFRKMRKQYPNLKWLYWHDDDVEQTAEGLLQLLSHKIPLVAGMYTTKEEDCHWCANFLHEVEMQPNGLLQVYEAAIGALLTHYQVYDIIEACFPVLMYTDRNTGERHFGFFQEVVIEKVPYSEDYFFCWLARYAQLAGPTEENPEQKKQGIGIFVDTLLRLKHRGPDGISYPSVWPPIPVDEKVEA
jgi:hypothetical protein